MKLPPLMRLHDWELIYSPNVDGISMHTFYQRTKTYTNSILLIQDSKGTVFGAYINDRFKNSKYFYGTGETFLFSFKVIYIYI